jgi:hypothetical protein
VHVVVRGSNRFATARHAAAREFADLHFGLGVERDTERFWFQRGLRVNLLQVLEDGVGLGKFFCGFVLRTRRSR